MKKLSIIILYCCFTTSLSAQQKPKFSISGTAGVSYDGYYLTTKPKTPVFYPPRRPTNLVRFTFQPTMSFGNFKLPFNFNFSPMSNNFASPPFGFGSLPGFPKQTLKQWIMNPMNTIGINPTYKWAELQLGTQYLKYSELSTGDIGAFGYGFSLKPGKFRVKFFRGISQQLFLPYTGIGTPPEFAGAYQRTITMGQIGLEKEGKYFAGFNIVKGSDDASGIPSPLTMPLFTVATPLPAANLIISFAANFNTDNGWYGKTELATTTSTRDVLAVAPSTLVKDFKPLLKTNTSSYRDHAVEAAVGKKGKDWDLGVKMKWLGAGYNTMGYPFVQNDRLEYTVNTLFKTFKKKVNVTASLGQRFGSWSTPSSRSTQMLANINIFAQISDQFNVNANYNNFGFTTPVAGGIKNVGNDLSINPVYTWSSTSMSNMLSLTYSWSKYKEIIIIPPSNTNNNSHTALLLYAPTFLNKPNLTTDFSVMYFRNVSSLPTKLKIITVSSSLGLDIPKKKLNLHSQLVYSNTTIDPFTPSNNIMLTLGVDWKMTKKLSWNTKGTIVFNKYGNELSTVAPLLGASYLENTIRTALLYRFGK